MSTVLITGANRGLGLEFVRQYAADGWEVLATARQPEKSEELKKLAGANSKNILVALDIVSDESVWDLAACAGWKAHRRADPEFGRLSPRRPEDWPNRLSRLARGL